MQIRNIALLAVAVLAVAGFAFARPAVAAPSMPLAGTLSTLRGLSESQFSTVVRWSRTGASRPFFTSSPEERAEVKVLDLSSSDRDATLRWLRGDGRGALYARGATDDDIGPRRPRDMSTTPSATPTPNPYRQLTLAGATLGNKPVGGIAVLGGFAAVKRDGRAVVVCISFKNVSEKVARRVLFDFPLYGRLDEELGELQLDRRGEFSPNVDINGWPDLSGRQGGVGHRGYNDNCTSLTQGVASRPLLEATGAGYRIVRVDYADGTSWSATTPH